MEDNQIKTHLFKSYAPPKRYQRRFRDLILLETIVLDEEISAIVHIKVPNQKVARIIDVDCLEGKVDMKKKELIETEDCSWAMCKSCKNESTFLSFSSYLQCHRSSETPACLTMVVSSSLMKRPSLQTKLERQSDKGWPRSWSVGPQV